MKKLERYKYISKHYLMCVDLVSYFLSMNRLVNSKPTYHRCIQENPQFPIALMFNTCGKWQEREFPCIRAFAYFQIHERNMFRENMETEVSLFYKCMTLYLMWKNNINPAIIRTMENNTIIIYIQHWMLLWNGNQEELWKNILTTFQISKCRRFNKKCGYPGHNSRTREIRILLEKC